MVAMTVHCVFVRKKTIIFNNKKRPNSSQIPPVRLVFCGLNDTFYSFLKSQGPLLGQK